MTFRTDLAVERMEAVGQETPGITSEESSFGHVKISHIQVHSKEGAEAINRPMGNYVTVEVPPFSDDIGGEDIVTAIRRELRKLLDEDGTVLVVGLGNTSITPDAFGPRTAAKILATRHITGEVARSAGLEELRGVAVMAPGVLGQTGIETGEIIGGVVSRVRPSALIVVDALASRRLSRLGCTVQMSDTGISPGSGVGNTRMRITKDTVGVPVISIGVPTVVDAATLAVDLTGHDCREDVEPRGAHMIVTPQEIDLLVDRAAATVAQAVNCALQPHIDPDILMALV